MTNKNFTNGANKVISLAYGEAVSMGHGYVGSEHLLLGILRRGEGRAFYALTRSGLTYDRLLAKVGEELGSGDSGSKPRDLSPKAKLIIKLAAEEAAISESKLIDETHILTGILRDGCCMGAKLIFSLGVSSQSLLSELFRGEPERKTELPPLRKVEPAPPETKRPESKLLRQFTKNLTAAALTGDLDPLIGRKDELAQTVGTLCRRTKNNPVLVGEPGVGKTAIVEGLAAMISRGEVPPELQNARLLSLDLSSVIAGTKYRGDFEERIKNIISEVTADENTILFIDELHTLVGAGGAEGAIDAANILKPALARGEIKLIGATTAEEYRRYVEKDAALERRFRKIEVPEPTENEALDIVFGLRPRFEAHHGISISNDAVSAAVRLSARFLPDRFLPDKALDLLDEAASRFRLSPDSNFSGLESEHISAILSDFTGIPLSSIDESEAELLQNLESRLSERVIGQKEAVSAIAATVKRGRLGISDPNRPIGSMLFLGASGVGKTELCRALAELLFGGKKSLIRLDMSEYSEKHSVSRLIGSPPGYAGYEDGGQLTEAVRRRPYSLVLFDELEKAHPDIFNVLLQILEDGTLTDSHGKSVSFKNTVIVMTSNAGAALSENKTKMGFGESSLPDLQKETEKELKKVFLPEFLNRIDSTITFRKFSEEDLSRISQKLLAEFSDRLSKKELSLSWDETVPALLAQKANALSCGARPLRRYITDLVQTPISDMLLSGKLLQGCEIRLHAENGRILVKETANAR